MTPELKNRISLLHLETVNRPIASANGLPNAVYQDADLFTFERDRVVGATWAALAFEDELPANGYLKPLDFMGLALVIMRNREGVINVFHNVCSHRGMPLVREAGAIEGALRCPYHSWTYDLNGSLKGTPHIGGVGVHSAEGFDCAAHGLKPVRSEQWLGVIFINLSADAPSLGKHVEPVLQRWQAFTGQHALTDVHAATSGSKMELEVRANWKLAVENYCESYHLPWVHPGLNSYSPLDQHYSIIVNGEASGQGSRNYSLAAVAGTRLPVFEQWPPQRIREAEYISLYPNLLLGIQADHVFAIILQPLASDRTLERLRLFYVGEHAASASYANCRTAVLEAWREVFAEDVFAVEGMQEGRNSPAFCGGVFSPVLDAPTHHFHRWVAGRYANSGD